MCESGPRRDQYRRGAGSLPHVRAFPFPDFDSSRIENALEVPRLHLARRLYVQARSEALSPARNSRCDRSDVLAQSEKRQDSDDDDD